MRRGMKIAVGVVGAVVVAGIVVVSVKSNEPRGMEVRTAEVARKDLVSLVTANGTIEARTKVDISANIMGQITKLNVEEGDHVAKGDLLLVIDQARYTASAEASRSGLESLEAELNRVRESMAQAKRDAERAETQYHEGILPEAEYERAKSSFEQATAAVQRAERQVSQARADLAGVRDQLEKTEIRAPMDGIVTRRNVEQGEVVVTGTMNNPGTVLMTISDMSTVEAVLEVDQTDVPRLRVGQHAAVRIDAFPDQSFPGVVAEIGSSPIQGASALGGAATGTDYEVKVTLQHHPDGVRPGLTVTSDIVTARRDNVLVVPIGALVLRSPEADATPGPAEDETDREEEMAEETLDIPTNRPRDVEGVYVVEDGKVAFRPTDTGIMGEMDVEVTSGVDEGQQIVVGPFRALRDLKPGDPVRIAKSPGQGPA